MRLSLVVILFFTLVSCVSSKKYASSQETANRLKSDSALLEKRIHLLQDEVNFLANKSATIEQSLNQRLQEKQDSITLKQQELEAKEGRINDMKARKVQEQEAFSKLSNSIIKPFSGYTNNEVVCKTNCTKIIVEVSDRVLFLPNTTKINAEKLGKIAQNIADILTKQPDLKLIVVNHTDSIYAGKEKWDDNWSLGTAKANAIVKVLIRDYQISALRLMPATQAEYISLTAENATLGKLRTSFMFYSELLPCVHGVE